MKRYPVTVPEIPDFPVIGLHVIHEALYKALVNDLYAVDPLFRSHAHWVMNDDWLKVVKAMADRGGRVHWQREPTHLLGMPFKVTADGGAPHLEMNPR